MQHLGKVSMKQCSKLKEPTDRVMKMTVGMYGDPQSVAGKSLLEVEGLSLAPGWPQEDCQGGEAQ